MSDEEQQMSGEVDRVLAEPRVLETLSEFARQWNYHRHVFDEALRWNDCQNCREMAAFVVLAITEAQG